MAFSWMRGTASMRLALGLCLMGCDDVDLRELGDPPELGEHGQEREDERNDCLIYSMYIVEGDQFTYLFTQQQSFPLSRHGSSETGLLASPHVELRANVKLRVAGNTGTFSLYWDGVVVDEFSFGMAFFSSGDVEVITYEDPVDGTRAELHVYGRPDWTEPLAPNQVLSRAEVEAFERP